MSEDTVKLGLMPPLTGLVGIYGSEISRAGEIACREVNENGGVLGRLLELVIEDDGSLPESSISAAEKLVDQHRCVAIIGNLLSNSRIAVAYRVAEPRRIPYLNFSFYEGSILSRYFFNFAALPNQQIDRMIPYMCHQHGPRMFFSGNNYEWPRGSIHAAKQALERAGGEVVGEEYCPIGVDMEDIERLLDHVEAVAPDVFVPYFAGADQVQLLTRFTERGLKKHIAVVMGHYDEMMASQLSPEVREGFYSSNTYFMTVDTVENRNYLARLANLPDVNGIWPNGNGILTNFGEGAYVCVKAFAQAANEAGSLEPEALVEALKTISVSAPQGIVKMNHEHHHAKVNTYLSRCRADGEFEIIEKFGAIEPQLPELYKHQQIAHQATLEDDIRLQARMLSQMSEGIHLVSTQDKQGIIIYANAGAERMFGYDKGEMIGISIARLNNPNINNPEWTAAEIIGILHQKGNWQGEISNIRKDGKVLWCSVTTSTFTHPVYGEVWLSVHHDITERKKAEEALRVSEERYEFAVQGSFDGLWDWNVKTGANYYSPRFIELLGYSQDDEFPHIVESFFSRLHPEDSERVSKTVQEHFEKRVPFISEYRLKKKDGSYGWFSARGQAIWDTDGVPIRMAGNLSDISNQKKNEAEIKKLNEELEQRVYNRTQELRGAQVELLRKERLATLGQLTATVSHELRNPLAAMRPSLYFIRKKVDLADDKLIKAIERIDRNVTRCDHIIDELLDFTRITNMELESVVLEDWLKGVLSEYAIHPDIRLVQTLSLGDYQAQIDVNRLRRAVINVIDNACQAMQEENNPDRARPDSQLTIETSREGGRIEIRIRDTGMGMPEDILPKIFEPLYSTKSFGVGLGMSIIKQIMEQHDGGVEVVSEQGKGTLITLWIPLTL